MQQRELSSPARSADETEDLYNNAPCGFYSLDHNGVFVRVNDTELRWLGDTREELIGRKKITDLIAPESLTTIEENFDRFKLNGSLTDVEVHLVRKDGSILSVLVSATAVRDSQGNLVMSRSVLYDLTQHKQAEQNFRSLLEATPDAMVVIKLDGEIVLVNAQTETIFGYRREELLGQKIEMLMPDRFRDRHAGHRTDYRAQPKVRPMGQGFELYGRRKNGTEFPVEISLSPLETDEGHLVVSAIRDIAGRKRMDEALRESEERFRRAFEEGPWVLRSWGRIIAS
jgi:protein-histidine pros-kinase